MMDIEPKGTLLYLDDDLGNLVVFETSFFDSYRVLTAQRASEAVEILNQEPVQVFLTDQRMPEKTGTELLREIRPRFPDLVTLIVTAYSDVDVVVQGVNECGIFRYVTKPWYLEDLRLTIEKALEAWNLRAENRRLITHLEARVEELQSLNTELASYTLRYAEQVSCLRRTRTQLDNALASLDETRQSLRTASTEAGNGARADRHWEDFQQVFDRLQARFTEALVRSYPQLTKNDLRLCALVQLNLTNHEIADIMGISPNSVTMARYRLKKKLGLEPEASIEHLLRTVA